MARTEIELFVAGALRGLIANHLGAGFGSLLGLIRRRVGQALIVRGCVAHEVIVGSRV